MDVVIGVRGHLAGLSALTALVPIERMYSPILQAKTFSTTDSGAPAIQIQVLPDEEEAHLRGPSQLFKDHVQVDAWARTAPPATTIRTEATAIVKNLTMAPAIRSEERERQWFSPPHAARGPTFRARG